MRSYRGPNTANTQTQPGPETQFLGSDHRDVMMMGFLADDAAPYGPVECESSLP